MGMEARMDEMVKLSTYKLYIHEEYPLQNTKVTAHSKNVSIGKTKLTSTSTRFDFEVDTLVAGGLSAETLDFAVAVRTNCSWAL